MHPLVDTNQFHESTFTPNPKVSVINFILAHPFEIVERQRELFEKDQELRKQYETLRYREEVRRKPFEELWDEFEELCHQNTGKEMDNETRRYAELLTEGLARHPERVKVHVIAVLNEANPDNYLLEEYLVPLAGILKLEETIPALFRILNETDFMYTIHQSCGDALGKIGTPEVIKGVQRCYSENAELRMHLPGILSHMPYEYTEDFAIRLLEQEEALDLKTFIAGSLCDIFSIKAADDITGLVEDRQYDPTIMSLIDHLVPIYAYYRQDVDLSELERADKKFREKAFKESPFYEVSQQLRKKLNILTEQEEQEQEQGQEQEQEQSQEPSKKPAPQRKGKAALKRAKKRKKKKRK